MTISGFFSRLFSKTSPQKALPQTDLKKPLLQKSAEEVTKEKTKEVYQYTAPLLKKEKKEPPPLFFDN